MTSEYRSRRRPQAPASGREPQDDDDIVHVGDVEDVGRAGNGGDVEDPPMQPGTELQESPERAKTPAYVAPIPKISSIPRISPGIQVYTSERPQLSPSVGSLLIGKMVDEYGDIVDEKTGNVLARAGGDLPSIVGRRVSNNMGDILGDSGELLGYVAHVEMGRRSSASTQSAPAIMPRSLFDLMGRSRASLMVDHLGNIIDASGNVVGKFHDNNNPLHRKEKEEREARERTPTKEEPLPELPSALHPEKPEGHQQKQPPPPTLSPQPPQQEGQRSQSPSEGQPRPRRTEEERRQNAEAWRKENPSESPSDIFLDVKSTRDGIQLTIRIPTVFGQQCTPNITFS
ncbi:hypothetical protein MMYC01_200920 [Madurella mycetomatis]|uniref:Uncharacterized protein n=1 Tax=Madurella mycetomatis TaxID=100816 RepID=A0A175VNU2_9PEZI|nr:hypothetical protein MMYC01_210438 [Madurella mycetomatis]KXX82030.1 hypothetical protein MMYC01_200920 [Madurella mycetomatis]